MITEYSNNKDAFINERTAENATYIAMYERLFAMASPFEHLHQKDLYAFTPADLGTMFNAIAKDFKYNTIVTMNSLVEHYKNWSKEQDLPMVDGICSIDVFKSITSYKQYVILSEDDILNMTEDLAVDGNDYAPVAFIKLFWEIDGQEKIKDILKVTIDDIDEEQGVIFINDNAYHISEWLIDFLLDFAQMDYLAYSQTKKHGRYPIYTAKENNGLIFRLVKRAKVEAGTPMTSVQFSNMIYQFAQRHLNESVTMDDIYMSLALRHMVTHKKSHTQMYTQQRYFKNMPSRVYAEVFKRFAKEVYPHEYTNYVQYYNELEKQCQ